MPFPDNGEYLNEYEAVVAKHFMPYSSLHLPTVVTFAVTDDIFTLGFGGQGFVPGHPAAPERRVHYITLHTPSLPSSLLMEKFYSSAWFSQVTELDFGTWYFSFDFNQLEIVPTLSSFSSLKTFSTNDVILHALLRLPSSLTATLFPVLTTLKMSNPNTPQPRTDSEEPPHHRFLQFRKVIGRPLSVFEISFPKPHVDKESPSYNMEYLEVHSGLLFRWKIAGEGTEQYRCYRCGDGHPERLRFNLANPLTIS
ncbi:hypothetical protein CPC08DRAFT_711489 [Agrocybe pediades]|nr:hypothetical protein CPC08DRAFT_711489 [Agrocybe pediades]